MQDTSRSQSYTSYPSAGLLRIRWLQSFTPTHSPTLDKLPADQQQPILGSQQPEQLEPPNACRSQFVGLQSFTPTHSHQHQDQPLDKVPVTSLQSPHQAGGELFRIQQASFGCNSSASTCIPRHSYVTETRGTLLSSYTGKPHSHHETR